ncbi:MAG: peptidoglycan DD-metalloendopeptidase family protein [Caulobacteraceae bacterium]|nr:peptidoglycan DD-metalloendopeptidase family protein [Caulobacteraceae bacterium]
MTRRVLLPTLLTAAGLLAVAAAAAPAISPAVRQMEADQREREQARKAALAQAETARAEVAQLQAQLAELNAAQARGDTAVSRKRLVLAALNVRETDLRARLGGDQNQLSHLLGVLMVLRRDPPPALLVDPHDVRDAVRAAILVRAMTPELERRAQALRDQAKDLQILRRQADTASESLMTSESDVAEQRARIESEIAAKTDQARQAITDASAAGQAIQTLSTRAETLRDLDQGLTTAAPETTAANLPDPEHAGLFGKPKLFTAPVPGAPSRRYGDAEPDGGGGHAQGWIWRTKGGPPVLAPAEAIVDYAGPLKGFGIVLILRLGGGYHLVLAGMETALAAPGQRVAAGQTVGRMAKADTPAPELYFEIRKNSATVDPSRWLKTNRPKG